MHHVLHLAHDVFGNPSVDEVIPAVLAFILLGGVLLMAARDTWKGWRRKGAGAARVSTTEDSIRAERDYLD